MNFGEKIIKLRKQKNLSQEELAEKLNVTRQTISKWELEQSKPDMQKLIEIASLFDVSVEVLTNESMDIEEKVNKKEPKKERKYLLYILIIILVASITTLAIRLSLAHEERKKQQDGFLNNIFGTITDVTNTIQNQIDNQMNDQTDNEFSDKFNETISNMQNNINNMQNESNKEKFNFAFLYSSGTKAAIFVENTLDSVITSNKTNKDHVITVVYKKNVTTEEKEIKNIKRMLDEWSEYEVSVDYDENGYVNKITIEDIK